MTKFFHLPLFNLSNRACSVGMLLLTMTIASTACITESVAADAPAAETTSEEAPAEKTPQHVDWTSDLAAAQKQAQQENKDLLLFFTGSDWCGYCIKLEEAVLTKPETAERIGKHYIPVVLDFPNKKELPEDVKTRNAELKAKLGIRGFPTLVAVDGDMLPYSTIVGYREPDAFWESFGGMTEVADKLTAAKDGTSVAQIEDVAQLDAVLKSLPDEVLKNGWNAQIERAVAMSEGKDETIHETWSDKLAEIKKEQEDARFMSQMVADYTKARREAESPEMVLAFLDKARDESQDRPDRVTIIDTLKVRYLFDQKMFDEATTLADEVIASEVAPANMKATVEALKRQIKFMKAREADGKPAGVPLRTIN
ncbi:thioredoxin fold domain-containing protein [Bremerella sp. JC817]|uniref:thioredoxin fold domain-containing protein n=1 Tax=Bremerella sp. JC817 TaxID=3231756 RepID=UPI0034599AF5